MPLAWLARPPRKVVAVVALRGMIAASRVGSLSMERCEAALEAVRVSVSCASGMRVATLSAQLAA
jgi:hypothetical protein